jgi:hypothetical protein
VGIAHHESPMKFQFSIASLLAITALTAVVASAYTVKPEAGIALSIAAAPALLRTAVTGMWLGSLDNPLPMGERLAHFVGWLFVGFLALGGGIVVTVVTGLLLAILGGRSGTPPAWDNVPRDVGILAAIVLTVFFWRKCSF